MKRNIKVFLYSCGIIAATCSLAGCHKQCACIHNNGSITYYTDDQIEELNKGNCSNMIYQSGTRYYVACDWD